MNDYWMLLVGVILAFLGVVGLFLGLSALDMPDLPDLPDRFRYRVNQVDRTTYTYKGRGAPVVMTVTAAVLLAMFFFSRPSSGTIPSQIANIVSIIACIVGAILVLTFLTAPNSGDRDLSQVRDAGLSLSEAARYLNVPEDKLLEMAQSGGITARHVEGAYHFDKDILDTYREAMRSSR